MILTPLPFDNPWKRSAVAFFFFNMMSTFMMWIVFDVKGFPQRFLENLFFLVPIFAVAIFLIGVISPVTNRAKIFVLILGFFGMTPILLFLMLPLFLYVIISNISPLVIVLVVAAYFVILLLWVYLSVKKTMLKEKKFGYLKSQIFEKCEKKYLNRSDLLDFSSLDDNPGEKKSFTKSLLIPLAFAGYPLQKLVASSGGHSAVLGFLSILCVPLSIYFIGRIASGYYLWIYSISKLERECKSKIMLVSSLK